MPRSASVSGLPSVAAAWIAVTGRQKRYSYFASKPAMKPSAIAKCTSAKARAASQASRPRCRTTVLAMRFQPSGESSYQNFAISDCSGVRVVLATWPISLTSARSRAYCALVSASGPSSGVLVQGR